MTLDRYTHERLAYSHVADHQRLAERLRAFQQVEGDRQQATRSTRSQWLSRLLRPLAVGRMPDLKTLQRL